MKRKQLTALGMAVFMGAMALAGCGTPTRTASSDTESTDTGSTDAGSTDTEKTDSTAASDGEVVELTFTGWEASPLETEAVKNGIKIFEEQHPNIKVNYTSGLSGTEYTAKLLTSAASNTLPDVMFMQAIDYRTFASKGIIMDITDKFDSEFPLDDFIDSSKQIMDYEGKVYGVSSCTVQPIIYYNKDLFDAAGVEYPSADPENCWTIDEFREVAKKLTEGDIYGCYGMELEGMWPALTNENGGHYFNDDYTEANFNTAENKEVFEAIKAIRVEDGSSPDASTLDNVGMTAVQMLETGKIAMLCDGSWALQEIAASGMNVGMAPLPSFKEASSSGQAHLHCISSKTEHPEEAWEFVKFLSGEEYQGSLIGSGLWMPNRHSWYTEEGLTKWYDEKVHSDSYKQMLDYFENAKADERAFQMTTKCNDSIKEEMEMYFKEDKDIDEAMTDAETRMTEAMAEVSAQ
jgi:multiple sugar transport system substrate-binding protein